MIDVDAIIRAYLASIPALITIFGARIYAARYLPSGYTPALGPACLFLPRGGSQDYSSNIAVPSVQFRIYAATEALARSSAAAVYDALNDTKSGQIVYARMDDGTFPTLLSEPDLNWPYMLMFFEIHIRKAV